MQDHITHPCFDSRDHFLYGRIHLPVAPNCNIKCGYCVRKFDCFNESKPGVTSRVIKANGAVERVGEAIYTDARIRVVGIAGPGEPLANPETFKTLEMVHYAFPELTLCISTNGLLLPDFAEFLASLGVRTLTVTINAAKVSTALKIYRMIGNSPVTEELCRNFLKSQLEGLRIAAGLGMIIKINTVLIPAVNSDEINEIALKAKQNGAVLMNIIPLIPQGDFSSRLPPSQKMLCGCQDQAEGILPQFRLCRQCRADAVGVPGEYDHILCGKK